MSDSLEDSEPKAISEVHGNHHPKMTNLTVPTETKQQVDMTNMSFEEKRKLLQAEYPNKRTPEERAKAREMLKLMANNHKSQQLLGTGLVPTPSMKPITSTESNEEQENTTLISSHSN